MNLRKLNLYLSLIYIFNLITFSEHLPCVATLFQNLGIEQEPDHQILILMEQTNW